MLMPPTHSQLEGASSVNQLYTPCVSRQWSVQVALLREKLAKEQQRARAAEATLAAQHQMQELLQCAVQAVLRARNSTQVHLLHGCVLPSCALHT